MTSRIDAERFRVLWCDGAHVEEIGQVLRISPNYVWEFARRLGLPKRPRAGKRPKVSDVVSKPDARASSEILRTGGRYRELAAYAQRHGFSLAQALQRWHRERAAA